MTVNNSYPDTYIVSVSINESIGTNQNDEDIFVGKHLIDLVVRNEDLGLDDSAPKTMIEERIEELAPTIASIISTNMQIEVEPTLLHMSIQSVDEWAEQKEQVFRNILSQSNVDVHQNTGKPYIVRMFVERVVGEDSTATMPVILDDVIVHAKDEDDAIETVRTAIDGKTISANVYDIPVAEINSNEINMMSISLDNYLKEINSELVSPFFKSHEDEPSI
ncbi:MAG: hypothetical protein D6732_17275 [Methanobacteriota archaeon]|nr:MAG: hypothetical protein D6732_17275 [Euryarchaeota archaeon]